MSKQMKRALAVFLVLLVALMAAELSAAATALGDGEDSAVTAADPLTPAITSMEPAQGGLMISWSKVAGIDYYRIYRYYTGKGWTQLQDTAESYYIDTNVASDTTYQYRVVGVSAKGSVLTNTDTKSVYYVAPPSVTGAECVADGIKVTWRKPDGVSKVAVLRSSGGEWQRVAESTGTSYLDKNVALAGSYRYTVRALQNDGAYMHTFFDEQGVAIRRLAAPSLRAANGFGGVSISWEPVEGAEGYRVFYYGSRGWTRLTDTKETSFLDTDVTSNYTYRYTVRCISADGERYTSYFDTAGKSVKYIAAPKLTGAESTTDGIRLSWTKSNGAAKYRIFYRSSNGDWARLADTTATSYTDEDVRSGQTYLYTVRCLDAAGSYCSAFDSEGIRCTFLTAPVLKSASPGLNGVDLSWDAVPGAENYRVYYYGSKGWTKLTDTTDTSVTDTDVSSGYTYTYTVRCISADGTRFTSGYRAGKSVKYIAAPVISDLSNTTSGVRISWGAVKGAAKYRVYYLGSQGWTRMTDTTATSYVDTDVSSGATYTYTVRCVSSDGGAFTSAFHPGRQLQYIAAPKITTLTSETGGVRISWNAVKGAAQYRLYYRNSSGWQKLTDTTATSVLDDDVSSGTTYTYTVRCLNGDGTAATSDFYAGQSVKYLSTPRISNVSNTTSGVGIRWGAVRGAEKYRIYYKGSSGWVKLTDTAATSYTDTAAVSGTTYTYTVRCVTADGKSFASSYDDRGTAIHYIASPKNIKATWYHNSIRISWDASGGAAKYRVYYYGGKGWTKLTDTTATSVYDDDVASGYTYRYTVRCITADGTGFTSDYDSTGASCRYTVMPRLHEPGYEKNGITLSWDKCPGAEKYRVYYYGSKGWTKLTETTGTSATDTKVASGNTYRYTVRCITADGRSFTSDCDTNGVSIYYVAAPRLANVATTSRSVTLTWTKPNGAAKFRVYKKISGAWTKLEDTTGTSYTDNAVSVGSTYTYTVRCISADGKRFQSGFDPNAFIITVTSNTDNFRYYDQTQYDYPYGDDTIGGSGCGPTSFAMIASTLTGKVITPVDAVEWCGNDYYVYNVGTMWSYFYVASERFGIKMEQQLSASQFDEVIAALKKGKYVISSQRAGIFTSGGHFIVLAGLDAQGRIIVFDPNGGNHYVGTAFTREQITESGTQYWIFDAK